MTLTRSYVIGRALAADTWLRAYAGVPLLGADAAAIERYLDTLHPASRADVERALVEWGDDALRRGQVSSNAARDLRVEIDLRDAAPVEEPARARRQARAR